MKIRLPKSLLLVSTLLLLTAVARPLNGPYYMPGELVNIEPCSTVNNTFVAGEEITYKLYYNWNFVWLSAGEVTFRVKDGGTEYHLSARGRTYKSYEWFYKVRDYYESYVDKKTLLPRMTVVDISEGTHTRYERVTFDRNGNRAVSLRGKSRDTAKEEVVKIDDCMHDILSIVYWSRNIDYNQLRPGQKVPIKFLLDRETYPLKVTYLGKEENSKIRNQGRFRTHKFSPQLIAGDVFKEGDEMTVWVSDDKNRIPLLIESPVSVGSVKAVLKDYKGLKYDFEAEIK